MGSATRNALAQATAQLDAVKGVKLTTGEQLLAAGRAIAGSAQLRAVLTDPSIDATQKSGLLGRVFTSLDATAAKLLTGIVESRWSSGDELVDGIETVGIRALAQAAGEKAGIEGELFAVGRAIASDADLELALGSKLGDPAAKATVITKLTAKKASPATVAILTHLVQSPRGRRIGELVSGGCDDGRRGRRSHPRDGHGRHPAQRRAADAPRDGARGAVRPRGARRRDRRPGRARRTARAGRRRGRRRHGRLPPGRPPTPARRLTRRHSTADSRQRRQWQTSPSAPTRSGTPSRTSSPATSRAPPPRPRSARSSTPRTASPTSRDSPASWRTSCCASPTARSASRSTSTRTRSVSSSWASSPASRRAWRSPARARSSRSPSATATSAAWSTRWASRSTASARSRTRVVAPSSSRRPASCSARACTSRCRPASRRSTR